MSSAVSEEIQQESDRLRQIARSFAAGDISQDDYRHIRTAMIDTFCGDDEDEGAENITEFMADAPQAVVSSGAVDQVFEGESPWTLLAIVAGGSALLAAVILLYFYLV